MTVLSAVLFSSCGLLAVEVELVTLRNREELPVE